MMPYYSLSTTQQWSPLYWVFAPSISGAHHSDYSTTQS